MFKEEITQYCKNCFELQQQLDQLKAKNEGLKKQYNCYACDTCNGKEDYINLKRHCENAIKSLHNKQAELDQLKEQLNAYKMEADEGKEINAELKAENDELKNRVAELSLFQLYKIQRDEAKQTLTEIKEIAERGFKHSQCNCGAKADLDLILQKISECEGNDE